MPQHLHNAGICSEIWTVRGTSVCDHTDTFIVAQYWKVCQTAGDRVNLMVPLRSLTNAIDSGRDFESAASASSATPASQCTFYWCLCANRVPEGHLFDTHLTQCHRTHTQDIPSACSCHCCRIHEAPRGASNCQGYTPLRSPTTPPLGRLSLTSTLKHRHHIVHTRWCQVGIHQGGLNALVTHPHLHPPDIHTGHD